MGDVFSGWIQQYGLPVAVLLGILWTNYRQIWLWGWLLQAEEVRHAETRQRLESSLATQRDILRLAKAAGRVLEREEGT